MVCIYIAHLSKAIYNGCLSVTHQQQKAAIQATKKLIGSTWRLGVLLRDTLAAELMSPPQACLV